MYNKKLFIGIERGKGAGCAGRNAHERSAPSLSLVGSMKYGRGGETVQGLVRNLVILVVGEHCKVGDVSLGM